MDHTISSNVEAKMNRAALLSIFFAVIVVSCGPDTSSPIPTGEVESAGSLIPESTEESVLPTEEPVPPTEEDEVVQTIISAGSSSSAYVGGQEIEIELDPSGELDTIGVEITIVDLGSTVVVQTTDPHGRFLPSVEIINKPGGDAVNVLLPQIDVARQGTVRIVEIADVRALMTELIETVDSAASLNELLNSLIGDSGLILLIEQQTLADEVQPLEVYQTPAHATVLAIFQERISGGGGMVAAPPLQGELTTFVIWPIPDPGTFLYCLFPNPYDPAECDPTFRPIEPTGVVRIQPARCREVRDMGKVQQSMSVPSGSQVILQQPWIVTDPRYFREFVSGTHRSVVIDGGIIANEAGYWSDDTESQETEDFGTVYIQYWIYRPLGPHPSGTTLDVHWGYTAMTNFTDGFEEIPSGYHFENDCAITWSD